MVSSNEGLEALAMLASGFSSRSSPLSGKKEGSRNEKKTSPLKGPPSSNLATDLSADTMNALQRARSAPAQTGVQQAIHGPSPPQWQQTRSVESIPVVSSNSAQQQLLALANLQCQLQQAQQHQQQQQQQQVTDPNGMLALQQQLNYFQLLQLAQQSQQPPASQHASSALQVLQLALQQKSRNNIPGIPNGNGSVDNGSVTQVLPTAYTNMQNEIKTSVQSTSNSSSMPPPSSTLLNIKPMPYEQDDHCVTQDDMNNETDGRKHQKRAANRRSAQLSRKRKKQFMEELKDENDGLRRKEQILKSIPDLIVVFDSSGKLWFVSESVSRFLDFEANELEGTSFWDRICDDSVRLIKAAFMDSLAARQSHSDTAVLGNGFWELRLVDKDRSQKVVTLHGVVHFAGDRPECVCSIRPHQNRGMDNKTDSDGLSTESPTKYSHQSLIHIDPQQSVLVGNDSMAASYIEKHRGGSSIRVSDSGNNSSSISDSGSSDENNDTVG